MEQSHGGFGAPQGQPPGFGPPPRPSKPMSVGTLLALLLGCPLSCGIAMVLMPTPPAAPASEAVAPAAPAPRRPEPPTPTAAAAPASIPAPPPASPVEPAAPPGVVSRALFEAQGFRWPLTVDEGTVRCEAFAISFVAPNGREYALNGVASSRYPRIDPIWAADPDFPGLKISIGPLIDAGQPLCRR